MKRLLLLGSLSGLLLASCDKVDDPNVPNPEFSANCDTVTVFSAPTQSQRNVLLEDFTGHKCNNCPWTHYLSDSLQANYYGDQLIVVAIHPDHPLADPSSPGAGSYETNWKTEEGIRIYDAFIPLPTGIPAGCISRVGGPSNYAINKFSWKNTIDTIVDDIPVVSIKSVTQWDAPTRTACVNSEIEFLAPMSGTFRAISYLVEDSIVDWQKNGSPAAFQGHPDYPIGDVPNFVHKHVLRDVFGHYGQNEGESFGTGNIWGDDVVSGTVSAGDKFYVRRSLEDISSAWNEDKLEVITFVYDVSTNEILQVVKEYLNP